MSIDARKFLPDLKRWEGEVPHLYRDNADAGNVTVGIGCMLPNLTAALALPFQISIGGARQVATQHDVMNDFGRVLRLPPGMVAAAYRAPTSVFLGEPDIEKLAINRVNLDFLPGLRRLCPGFDGFPAPAQSALTDMAFNLGIGSPATVTKRATGLHGFPTLIRYCNAGEWELASKECKVKQGRDERNDWRKSMFLAAAHPSVA